MQMMMMIWTVHINKWLICDDGDPGVVVINHNWETSHVTASFEMQNRSVETEASGRRIHHQYQSNSHNEATQRQEGNIAAVNRKF